MPRNFSEVGANFSVGQVSLPWVQLHHFELQVDFSQSHVKVKLQEPDEHYDGGDGGGDGGGGGGNEEEEQEKVTMHWHHHHHHGESVARWMKDELASLCQIQYYSGQGFLNESL